jgi:hypothetical protein
MSISLFNVCEDSLLAYPLIIDLVITAEMMTRISWKSGTSNDYKGFHSVLSVLSYMLKVIHSIAVRPYLIVRLTEKRPLSLPPVLRLSMLSRSSVPHSPTSSVPVLALSRSPI